MRNAFFRGHGLGNDYLVVDPDELDFALTPESVRSICDRHRGVGSDGILVSTTSGTADFGLRIFNPDGSEAEKSGNGLRIFARYLHATGRVRESRFSVETPGGRVTCVLHLDEEGDASSVTVQMGRASFVPRDLPCALAVDELIDQPIEVAGRRLRFTGVSVGNPHCVLWKPAGEAWTREELLLLGPALEQHPVFPRRTNVQLGVPVGSDGIRILIWERGAGETQASGSSSCAAASAAVRLGLVRSPVTVVMPGGRLVVEVGEGFDLTMTGPVEEVARGTFSPSFVRRLSSGDRSGRHSA
ncbi:MAG: diaminopimelate epimerase [Myxococcota bacterium]